MSNASASSSLFWYSTQEKSRKYRRTEEHVSSQREDFDLRQAVFIHSALFLVVLQRRQKGNGTQAKWYRRREFAGDLNIGKKRQMR